MFLSIHHKAATTVRGYMILGKGLSIRIQAALRRAEFSAKIIVHCCAIQ